MGRYAIPRYDSWSSPSQLTTSYQNNSITTWDPTELFEIINPAIGQKSCVGWAPTRSRRCQWRLGPSYFQLERIAQLDPYSADIEPKLRVLAEDALCHHHQNQVSGVVDTWMRKLKKSKPRRLEPSEPVFKSVDSSTAALEKKIRELEEQLKRFQQHMEKEQEAGHRAQAERERERQEEEDRKARERERQERERQEREREEKEREEKERQEKERQEKEREEKEREERERKKREEEKKRREREERQRQEKAAREKEEQERKEKERREAQERNERERLAREKAEKRKEWDEIWRSYSVRWGELKKTGMKGNSEALHNAIPWPVKSGHWEDVTDVTVKEFYYNALPANIDATRKTNLLRMECKTWHTDRAPKWCDEQVDGSLYNLFNTITRVVIEIYREANSQRDR
ncbi:hypothetical protein AOQ84DRAFT_142736 [Glonium stellatum]|uniref:Uncharacterized protein n=1 Tax=Glonium stellatum TaxID=574774 RepID=A0A8E2ES39_9PEZI|nr:hypothetical protein AOQ84DRAFT_142736 [Glonium stellatum]